MIRKTKKHFFKILPLFVVVLIVFALTLGVWLGLPVEKVSAAADDYGVSGGDIGALPIVGAASGALNLITITDAGGDDFTNDPEILTIAIDNVNYPAVVFDQTITALTIAGNCGFNGHNAVTYTNAYTITIPITGGTSCTAGQLITVAGLQVETIYAQAAPGAVGLINVDNTTTSTGSPITSVSTMTLAVTAADAAASLTLADGLVGAVQNTTLNITVPVDIYATDYIEFDAPANLDVSSVAATSNTFGGAGDFNCTNTGGQTIKCTVTGIIGDITASTGTIVMSGITASSAAIGQIITNVVVYDTTASANVATDASGTVTDTIAVSGRSGGGGGDINPPDAPTNINLIADSTGTVVITWTDPIDNDLNSIVIQRDHAPLVGSIVDTIYDQAGKSIQTYSESGLKQGETYLYRVRAKDLSNNLSTNMEVYSIIIPVEENIITEEEIVAPPIIEEVLETNLDLQDPAPAGPLPADVKVGQLVKLANMNAVYFIDQDNRRHAFPNEATYMSWFTDFSGVETISAGTMAAIPLGSNVIMRPGTYLIKVVSDPNVYAVEPYGVIRRIKTENIAENLFGLNWASKVVDIDVSFFINYVVGSPIDGFVHPEGSVIQYTGQTENYYIENDYKRVIPPTTFSEDLFQENFVIKNISTSIAYPISSKFPVLPIETLMAIK
ncbi:hypothetical protein ACFL2U_00950 [Patescibacteria group bacterium]